MLSCGSREVHLSYHAPLLSTCYQADLRLHIVGAQPSTGKPVFIRPELKNGPLARAAAAAAQRPTMPDVAQPMGSDQANEAAEPGNAQQGSVVGRLKQQYEGKAVMGTAAPGDKVCITLSPCLLISKYIGSASTV